MEEKENGEEVILNTSEEEVAPEPTETDEESVDDVRAKLAKAQELADNYKIRAEKAEKKGVKTESHPTGQSVSIKDLYALSEAKVHQDDIAEVEKYARYEGISITDALKTAVLRSILNEKSELRNTSIATNTGGARRGTGKASDEALVANAAKGSLPENEDDLDRLIRIKMFGK